MESKDSLKILLIGDYLIFRTGLKMLLETEAAFRVVGQADTVEEAAELIYRNRPQVVLIDAPETDSEEFAAFLERCCADIPFVILSGTVDPEMFRRCFQLGASGLISKEQTPDVLFKAVRKVAQGELWFDRTVMGQTIRELMAERETVAANASLAGCSVLSEREKEVLALVCKGFKNKVIADNLFISETTVRHHLTSIFEKLEVNSRLQLVVLAFERNLVEIPVKAPEKELTLTRGL